MISGAIAEVEYAGWRALTHLIGPAAPPAFDGAGAHVLYTGTGRAALRIILEYLTRQGRLRSKNDPVLVNQWLCQSVLYTMHRFCHPTLTAGPGLKAVMAYHQYGFPQDMDEIVGYCAERDLVLIEDCANVYESHYKGRRLGTFGLGAIFSFAKLFPSVLGGALLTQDDALRRFGADRLASGRSPLLSYAGRILYECCRRSPLAPAAGSLQEMVYAVTDSAFRIAPLSLRLVSESLTGGALRRRKENYLFVLDYFADRGEYFAGLEREGVVPYVAPLFAGPAHLERIKKRLLDHGVLTGIYHFDVRRNVLSPRFEECVWVPIHQGLTSTDMERICALIKGAV